MTVKRLLRLRLHGAVQVSGQPLPRLLESPRLADVLYPHGAERRPPGLVLQELRRGAGEHLFVSFGEHAGPALEYALPYSSFLDGNDRGPACHRFQGRETKWFEVRCVGEECCAIVMQNQVCLTDQCLD